MKWGRWLGGLLAIATAGSVASMISPCSIGGGSGSVSGTLDVVDCWSGKFNLQPDFFAAIPYNNQMMIRIQNGSDYENFSDGVQIAIDDVAGLRANSLGKPIAVALPPSVTPPGVPIPIVPDPATVHFSLYLQRTCELETPALYATRAVSLNPDGSCGGPTTPAVVCSDDGGPVSSDAGATDAGSSDGGATSTQATSTITFTDLFDGDPNAASADERFTSATFDVYLADPREVCPGGVEHLRDVAVI